MTARFCDEIEERGTLAQYVAGTLNHQAVAELEDHFLVCARCQASVRAGVITRDSADLVTVPAAGPRRWYVPAGLVAAALAGIFVWQGQDNSELRELGRVDVAPIYLGAQVRTYETADVILFDSAMTLYAAGRYQEAAGALDRARTAGADDAALDFFLGASQLMSQAPAAAERSFTSVIARGRNLYAGEAYFYRAKARLQRGDRAGAIADLQSAAGTPSATADAARVLLQQLEV